MTEAIIGNLWRTLTHCQHRNSHAVGLIPVTALMQGPTVWALPSVGHPHGVSWIRQFGTSESNGANSVTVDRFGSSYVKGATSGNLAGANPGERDAFLIKYDSQEYPLWSRQIGTNMSDEGRAVAVDGAGNVFVAGVTNGVLDVSNFGSVDVFVQKYSPVGSLIWSRQTGSDDTDLSYSMAVDTIGNAYITGLTFGDMGGSHVGLDDAFLLKHDPSGNLLWSQQFGAGDAGFSVSVDGLILTKPSIRRASTPIRIQHAQEVCQVAKPLKGHVRSATS